MKRRPSSTSLVAFALIVSPFVYVLSYAPFVRFSGRAEMGPAERLASLRRWEFENHAFGTEGSLYPAYKPVDWLIDNTPLREPLFLWAGLWSVRDEFEPQEILFDSAPEEGIGSSTVIRASSGPP